MTSRPSLSFHRPKRLLTAASILTAKPPSSYIFSPSLPVVTWRNLSLSLSLSLPTMATVTNHHHAAFLPIFLLILLLTSCCVESQSPPNNGSSSNSNDKNNNNNNNGAHFTSTNFNPSMAIVIVVLISAFFFLGFFSIYIRQCGGDRMDSLAANAAAAFGGRSRRQRGLDPAVLETFPTLVYSEVKEHKIGKGALECAICLNEFEDDDTLRLLPKCDHVFHQECIDAWLATHVTCPVCRTNYADSADPPAAAAAGNDGATVAPAPPEASAAPAPAEQVVVISVEDDEERKEEMRELARIASRVRGNGSRRPRRLPRSHSTGHSMVMRQGDGFDRYTLRLPENVRKEIIAAGMLRRARSFAATGGGEGSSRRVSRGIGEGSSRRWRSIRLGRSDRWPSFFVRSLSAKIPAWGNWRRGEEGSVTEGSLRGKFAAGAGGSKHNPAGDSDESSTAVLNRV